MVDAVYIDNNRVQVVQNDDISFDTDRPSVAFFPTGSEILIQNVSVIFPSLVQQSAYFRASIAGQGAYCEKWSTILWQEWGPDKTYHNEVYYSANPGASIPGPTTRNLPSQVIGSVPSNANFLDIRARIRRTITPPLFYNFHTTYLNFKENEWIPLPGGSCPVEFSFEMRRMFQVDRIGDNLVLSRQQSVKNNGDYLSPAGVPWSGDNIGWINTGNNNQGVAPGSLVGRANNQVGVLMDQRGPDSNGNKIPGGANACDAPWPDTSSQYSVDFLITPGVYRDAT
jgi:hypothetical protein